MTITQFKEEKTLTLAIEGRLDTMTSPQLDEALPAVDDEVEALVIDCEKLEYISSSGLRVLLKAQKMMAKKGSMKLVKVNELVSEVFEITGFNDILTIE